MTGILPKTANRVCRQISNSPATSCFEEQRLPERTGYPPNAAGTFGFDLRFKVDRNSHGLRAVTYSRFMCGCDSRECERMIGCEARDEIDRIMSNHDS